MKIPILYNIECFIRKIKYNVLLKIAKNKNLSYYDLIFSLGELCFCAGFLKSKRLRLFSCPFDWIYGSSFLGRMDILNNKFKDFLNIEDLEYVGERLELPGISPANIFKNKRTNIIFNHDFKVKTPLEKSFPNVKKKYERRIKRLLKNLSYPKKDILIVYMESPNSNDNPKDDFEIIEAVEKLNKTFKANINLMYFKHDENMQDYEYYYKKIKENITKITLCNRNKNDEENCAGNFVNSSLLLGTIALNKSC